MWSIFKSQTGDYATQGKSQVLNYPILGIKKWANLKQRLFHPPARNRLNLKKGLCTNKWVSRWGRKYPDLKCERQ